MICLLGGIVPDWLIKLVKGEARNGSLTSTCQGTAQHSTNNVGNQNVFGHFKYSAHFRTSSCPGSSKACLGSSKACSGFSKTSASKPKHWHILKPRSAHMFWRKEMRRKGHASTGLSLLPFPLLLLSFSFSFGYFDSFAIAFCIIALTLGTIDNQCTLNLLDSFPIPNFV